MRQLGAEVSTQGSAVHVLGPEDGLRACGESLDCGNSGTTMRLLAGLVSGVEGSHELVGDPSLSKRPMDRVARPLGEMGAVVRGQANASPRPSHRATRRCAPLSTRAHGERPGEVSDPLRGTSRRRSHDGARGRAYRRTTEDMFRASGIEVESNDVGEGRVVTLQPGRPKATSWSVPGDPSQAAFFCVLGPFTTTRPSRSPTSTPRPNVRDSSGCSDEWCRFIGRRSRDPPLATRRQLVVGWCRDSRQ